MTKRGRHRAPGRHARPKNHFAPLTAISISGLLIFGTAFSERAYSVEPVAVPVEVVASAEDNTLLLSSGDVSRSDNRQIIPDPLVQDEVDPNEIRRAQILAGIDVKTIADAKKFAQLFIETTYGWDDEQFSCLDNLFERESHWRYDANNPTSSAYGIPQALPGSRMAEIADDWQTNPVTQIKWGVKYIEKRYGTPCVAYNKALNVGWY